MENKEAVYYVTHYIRHNGVNYERGNILTKYDLEAFKPEEIESLLKRGGISTTKPTEYDGYLE